MQFHDSLMFSQDQRRSLNWIALILAVSECFVTLAFVWRPNGVNNPDIFLREISVWDLVRSTVLRIEVWCWPHVILLTSLISGHDCYVSTTSPDDSDRRRIFPSILLLNGIWMSRTVSMQRLCNACLWVNTREGFGAQPRVEQFWTPFG
jgi:hypothetical protein